MDRIGPVGQEYKGVPANGLHDDFISRFFKGFQHPIPRLIGNHKFRAVLRRNISRNQGHPCLSCLFMGDGGLCLHPGSPCSHPVHGLGNGQGCGGTVYPWKFLLPDYGDGADGCPCLHTLYGLQVIPFIGAQHTVVKPVRGNGPLVPGLL